ncbi:MAG: pseudouridine synthase [Desulfotalea sp.]|nr:MAG: pseudouridine synthase [Desulfotalea sp.]
MGISTGRSTVFMPDTKKPYPNLLTFLVGRFPHISKIIWEERLTTGKVLAEDGSSVSLDTPYGPNQRLFYFREVPDEPQIPFHEKIIYSDEHLLVVCKPHFLPVTPAGPFVSETLLNRLKATTGNVSLSPINRIDRGTAGLVLISAKKQTRGLYQKLFMDGMVQKTYQAVVEFPGDTVETEWLVENRIEQGEPWFRMQACEGTVNARSTIVLLTTKGSRALLELSPATGKKHQLRIHLSGLGLPIVGDRYYPILLEKSADDYALPLQLLSKKIEFTDPISGVKRSFESARNLVL